MKRIISLVIASAAVAMALVSCTKEITTNNEGEKGINADGSRTLTVSFAANPTKTTLSADGITPVWAEGDEISLNGTPYTVPASAVGKSTCTITTDIQGDITAVYPARAYQPDPPYFKVSDKQDGSFGCANICVAQAAAGENTLTFENKTAVFAVAVPEGTTKLTVTSLGKIDSETGRRGTDATDTVAINTTKTGSEANVIIVEKKDKSAFENDSVYVAVAVDEKTGVLLADLNFDTGKAQGGVSPKYIKSKGQEPLEYRAAAGTIYTPVLHEYVVVNGKKWATMNIGATASKGAPSSWGYYLAWGAVEPICYLSIINTTDGPKIQISVRGNNPDTVRYTGGYDPYSVFANCNAPYYNSSESKYTKYTGTDNKPTLDLVDDAAFYWWGGSWRMPTKEEFDGLKDRIIGGYNSTDNGCYIGNSSDSEKFFLTASGMVIGGQPNIAVAGNYWTSSLNPDNSNIALTFDIAQGRNGFDDTLPDYAHDRSYGRTVRALSD